MTVKYGKRRVPEDVGAIFRYNVSKLRQAHKLSYRSLGSKAGVSGAYMYQIEEGLRDPTAKTMAKIALAFGVSVASLVSPEGEI